MSATAHPAVVSTVRSSSRVTARYLSGIVITVGGSVHIVSVASSRVGSAASQTVIATLLLTTVIVTDQVLLSTDFELVRSGVLDEAAHVATTSLVLLVLHASGIWRDPTWRLVAVALTATVAIDLDHVPALLTTPSLADAVSRPPTHSLTMLVVLALVLWSSGASRPLALPVAIGLGVHLVRDLAWAPGVPLLWPIGRNWAIPLEVYEGLLIVLCGLVPLQALLARRSLR